LSLFHYLGPLVSSAEQVCNCHQHSGRNYSNLGITVAAFGLCILINLAAVNFEDYLKSKKIDSAAFLRSEPERWKTWSAEFEQVHPNSFTLQKLNLINPLRRKYLLKQEPIKMSESAESQQVPKPAEAIIANPEIPPKEAPAASPKPAIPRPVFKPKPKTN